jgi:nucleoside-diphosphate-sugar epimerase
VKVFLTGATGYIGSAIAEALQAAGHAVLGLARSPEAEENLREHDVEPASGDLTKPDTLVNAVRASEAVIHAGTTNNGVQDSAAVGAMLKAREGSAKPFIYTSGIWVLGDTGGQIADEESPVNPAALVAWRPALEQLVIKSGGVVIRPAIVYGRGGGIPAGFVQAAREQGVAKYVGDGENRWPFVHVEDLADLYAHALERGESGALFHAVDGPSVRVKEVAEAASFAGDGAGRIEAWPLEQARGALGALADALVLDQQVSAEKARKLLGWMPRGLPILEDLRYGSYAMPSVSP